MCCCHSRYCYIAQYIDQRLPAPEVGDAATIIDGDEGDGEEGDRQQNNSNDGVIVRDNLINNNNNNKSIYIAPNQSRLFSGAYVFET